MLTSISFASLRSDQLFTWSDEYTERIRCRAAKTPRRSCASTSPAQIDSARLAHRAIQAMWQAGVQMRRRPRPWPQILPFGEPPGLAATHGLCAARVSRSDYRVHCQLPPGARDLRSDLRDQPRTAAPPGGALNGHHERSSVRPPCVNRCWIGWRAPRQYGRSLARWQPRLFGKCGGSR